MEQEMEKRKGGRTEKSEEKWVHDASVVDHKGRLPLRASTGVWKASLFVLGEMLLHISLVFSYHFNTALFFILYLYFHHKLARGIQACWHVLEDLDFYWKPV